MPSDTRLEIFGDSVLLPGGDEFVLPGPEDLPDGTITPPLSIPEGRAARALDRGGANFRMALGSALDYLGQRFGVQSLEDVGLDVMENAAATAVLNPSDVPSYEDVETLSDVGTFILERAVEQVPQFAAMAVGGLVGGAAAGVGRAFLQRAAVEAGKKSLRRAIDAGRIAGMTAAIAPQHLGEGAMELRDGDVALADVNSPFLTMAVNTLLDVGPFEFILRTAFRSLDPDMAKDIVRGAARTAERSATLRARLGRVMADAGRGAAAAVPIEGVTEYAQELVNQAARAYYDPNFDINSPDAESQRLNALFAGAAAGGLFGGAARGGAAAVREFVRAPSEEVLPVDTAPDDNEPRRQDNPVQQRQPARQQQPAARQQSPDQQPTPQERMQQLADGFDVEAARRELERGGQQQPQASGLAGLPAPLAKAVEDVVARRRGAVLLPFQSPEEAAGIQLMLINEGVGARFVPAHGLLVFDRERLPDAERKIMAALEIADPEIERQTLRELTAPDAGIQADNVPKVRGATVPAREPKSDLRAQFKRLEAGERKGMLIPVKDEAEANRILEWLSKRSTVRIARLIPGKGILVGRWGVVTKIKAAEAAAKRGDTERVDRLVGEIVGIPENLVGKAGDAVVRERDADGNVVMEASGPPDEVQRAARRLADEGRNVDVTDVTRALAERQARAEREDAEQRAQRIADEQLTPQERMQRLADGFDVEAARRELERGGRQPAQQQRRQEQKQQPERQQQRQQEQQESAQERVQRLIAENRPVFDSIVTKLADARERGVPLQPMLTPEEAELLDQLGLNPEGRRAKGKVDTTLLRQRGDQREDEAPGFGPDLGLDLPIFEGMDRRQRLAAFESAVQTIEARHGGRVSLAVLTRELPDVLPDEVVRIRTRGMADDPNAAIVQAFLRAGLDISDVVPFAETPDIGAAPDPEAGEDGSGDVGISLSPGQEITEEFYPVAPQGGSPNAQADALADTRRVLSFVRELLLNAGIAEAAEVMVADGTNIPFLRVTFRPPESRPDPELNVIALTSALVRGFSRGITQSKSSEKGAIRLEFEYDSPLPDNPLAFARRLRIWTTDLVKIGRGVARRADFDKATALGEALLFFERFGFRTVSPYEVIRNWIEANAFKPTGDSPSDIKTRLAGRTPAVLARYRQLLGREARRISVQVELARVAYKHARRKRDKERMNEIREVVRQLKGNLRVVRNKLVAINELLGEVSDQPLPSYNISEAWFDEPIKSLEQLREESFGSNDEVDNPESEDVRRFETVEQQAEVARQLGEALRADRQNTRPTLKTVKDGRVRVVGKVSGRNSVLDEIAALTKGVLDSVGMGNLELTIATRAGLEALAEKTDDTANKALISRTLNDSPAARVLFLRAKNNRNVRIPVIYLGDITSRKAVVKGLLHELGHVVTVKLLSGLPDDVIADMQKVFGEGQAFYENLANLFATWALAPRQRRTVLKPYLDAVDADAAAGRTISRFFERLLQALRDLWKAFRKAFTPAQVGTFSDFMEQWVGRVSGKKVEPQTELGRRIGRALDEVFAGNRPRVKPFYPAEALPAEYLDFSIPAGGRAPRARKFATLTRQVGEEYYGILRTIYDRLFKTYDAVLRDMGEFGVKFADNFRRVPGVKQKNRIMLVENEIQSESAPFMRRLKQIVEPHIKPWRPWHMLPGVKPPEPSAEMKQAVEELIAGKPDSPLAREIRRYFDDLYRWLRKRGVYVPYRSNYFPVAMDRSKLAEDGALDEVIRIVKEWAKTKDGKAWWNENRRSGEPMEFTEQDAERVARSLYSIWTRGEPLMETVPGQEQDGAVLDFVSPGFAYGKERSLPASLIAALDKFRERDVTQLMYTYTRAAIKRGVWQRRFGLRRVLAAINRRYDEARNTKGTAARMEKFREVNAYRDAVAQEYMEKYGVNIFDPAAGLKVAMHQARSRGDLSKEDYERMVKEIIPAYQGLLGASQPEVWRKMQAVGIVYQNLRLLSLAVLSQFVDVGLVMNRLPKGYRTQAIGLAIRGILDKRTREQLLDDTRIFGVLSDDITDHILNDETGVMLASRNIERTNEWFFRVNGMHMFTGFWRGIALEMGRRLIKDWAEAGNDEALAEIGITVNSARRWVADGSPIDIREANGHRQVLAGLHQFVDESILRPSPTTRGWFGNDQRVAVFWHLKSFTWQFAKQILQRAWEQAKAKWGETEGIRRFAAALPFLTLAAWTLPLAALGMEIRWLIAPPKHRPEGGWDYFWETVQRVGLTGIAQPLIDAHDAEKYGRIGLFAVAGPTVSQMEEFVVKDLGAFLERAYPAYPIVNSIRDGFEPVERGPNI